MGIPRLVFLGISLGIIAFAIASGAYKLPGQIAGTVANPLLIDNKFCSDPASPNQTGCVSFISSALAQTMSSPYQNVSGPVSISGNVDVSGNIKMGASRTNSALVWDFGHKIGREASDGSLHIGGGQDRVVIENGVRFSAYGAGTLVTNASGIITASSDERLKNITGTFNRGLSSILRLNPILYQWNKLSGMESEYTYAGFSAQDVKQTIPEAVGVNKDGYLTLSDRPIIAALVNAIKEQQKEIDLLKQEIETLKAR